MCLLQERIGQIDPCENARKRVLVAQAKADATIERERSVVSYFAQTVQQPSSTQRQVTQSRAFCTPQCALMVSRKALRAR